MSATVHKRQIRLTASQDLATSEPREGPPEVPRGARQEAQPIRNARSLSSADAARFLADPYSAPIERQSRHLEVEVAVVGAGLGGLVAAPS